MKLKNEVRIFIEENNLCREEDKLLVALSGGADSVALLRLLLSLGYPCEAAHCNFHLRGEESDRDEDFVRRLCETVGVPIHVTHFDTSTYARTHRLSIEMAARELRYEWFEALRRSCKAAFIAVAHHRDDNVETLLLNLIRGTGINGLTGMSPRNGRIIRPLLGVSREDILGYLEGIRQDFVTDSTNLQDEYMRNKIRLNILPLMKELNPSVEESIAATQRRLAEVAEVYNAERRDTLGRLVQESQAGEKRIAIADIVADKAPASLLHELLYPLGFNHAQTCDLLRSLTGDRSGRRFRSKEWEVLRDRTHLLIHRSDTFRDETPVWSWEIVDITPSFVVSKDSCVATLDADKVDLPIRLRPWEEGDCFVPFGMTGRKSVCKYMTDKKFSLFAKECQQVAVSAAGDIIWLVGDRTDNRFRITADTRRALVVKVIR